MSCELAASGEIAGAAAVPIAQDDEAQGRGLTASCCGRGGPGAGGSRRSCCSNSRATALSSSKLCSGISRSLFAHSSMAGAGVLASPGVARLTLSRIPWKWGAGRRAASSTAAFWSAAASAGCCLASSPAANFSSSSNRTSPPFCASSSTNSACRAHTCEREHSPSQAQLAMTKARAQTPHQRKEEIKYHKWASRRHGHISLLDSPRAFWGRNGHCCSPSPPR